MQVKKITLYKNGIGYFERQGKIEGDGSVDIFFNTWEMNDVLKTLNTRDLSGGEITYVSYDSNNLPDNRKTALDDNLRKVTIFSNGEGERTISAGFAIKAPLWKVSYRVNIDEKKKIWLQGWAIFENNSGLDWDNVRLTIVTEKPTPFIHNLYSPGHPAGELSPQYTSETEIERMKREDELMRLYDENDSFLDLLRNAVEIEMNEVDPERIKECIQEDISPDSNNSDQNSDYADEDDLVEENLQKTVIPDSPQNTDNQKFETHQRFEIDHPITVKRGQSAMVPIINMEVKCRKTVHYIPSIDESHPLNALLLINSSDFTLEEGPVTIFEMGRYTGESILPEIKSGEEKAFIYNLETGCEAKKSETFLSRPTGKIQINKDFISLETLEIRESVYCFKNNLETEIELFLYHRSNEIVEIIDTPEPEYRDLNDYIFCMTIPAKSEESFTVKERYIKTVKRELRRLKEEYIDNWTQSGNVDNELRTQLLNLHRNNENNDKIEETVKNLNVEIQEEINNQDRIRKNLQLAGTVANNSKLVNRYAEDLEKSEDQLKDLKQKLEKLKQEKKEQTEAVNELIESLKGFSEDLS